VNWLTDRHLFAAAVAVYGLATVYAVFLWRKGFSKREWISYLLLLLGFLCHSTAMTKRGLITGQCPIHNLYEATVFVTWTMAGVYVVAGLWSKLRFLGAFAAPVLFAVGVFALMPMLDLPHGPRAEFAGAGQSMHAATILLAYGTFGFASVAALMYLTQVHNLKFNKLRALVSLFPPIQRLELITGRLLLVGVCLLTFGLLAGAHLANKEGVAYWKDAKALWSAVLWACYTGLLVARWRLGWYGRRFALSVVGIFVFLILTFWVTNLLSVIHNTPPPPVGQGESKRGDASGSSEKRREKPAGNLSFDVPARLAFSRLGQPGDSTAAEFRFRISGCLRISDFGLRISALRSAFQAPEPGLPPRLPFAR